MSQTGTTKVYMSPYPTDCFVHFTVDGFFGYHICRVIVVVIVVIVVIGTESKASDSLTCLYKASP